MSRLDSAIRRLQAQKLSLDWAVAAIGDRSGNAIELGLGNGRTFDHLRSLMPERPFYVFDRQVAAHPDCIPAEDRLFLGDFRETLPAAAERLGRETLLAHLDIGTGEKQASMALAAAIAPLVDALLADGAVVVSDQPVDLPRWKAAALPDGIGPGRIHLYEIGRA
ncbi:class I SAM-dependent methyltransferase [Nisaea acidiphila]|uniref:Class I SAM-dependent methyltransferase n=1 Tax=Nisaea acidiphila TaxID=1862145 RepID=A0A9J7ANU7_9PROT|nr:class I SAM-dependent methyltransferase [Nisaea acidiphila]UUX48004.1 class I SAM-dependent methyltransferase [Nisaea acidiphila]